MSSPLELIESPPEAEPDKKNARHMFTMEEDNRLCELVNEFGDKNWRVISRQMPNRTTRQCRERYRNYLSPRVKNGPWTQEEDILLEQKYLEYGPRWATIAKFFPSRSDVNIKNRWASNRHKSVRTTPKSILDSLRITQRELWQQLSRLHMQSRVQVVRQEPEKPDWSIGSGMVEINGFDISDIECMLESRVTDQPDWEISDFPLL